MAKIQQKRSSAAPAGQAKAPDPSQLDYGELAVNFSELDPSIFIKASNNTVVKMSGVGAIGMPELPDDLLRTGEDIAVNSVTTTNVITDSITAGYYNLAGLPDISAAP